MTRIFHGFVPCSGESFGVEQVRSDHNLQRSTEGPIPGIGASAQKLHNAFAHFGEVNDWFSAGR
jgi:hypothetical protein